MAEGNLTLEVRIADAEPFKRLIEAVGNLNEAATNLNRALEGFGKKEPLPDFDEIKRQATGCIGITCCGFRRVFQWRGQGDIAKIDFEYCGDLMAAMNGGGCPFIVEWLLPDFENRCWYVRKTKSSSGAAGAGGLQEGGK